MTEELKPCPFCGCEAEIRQKGNNHTSKRSVTIRCKGCRFQRTDGAIRYGMDWLVEVASHAWNTRPSPWISVKDRLPERHGLYWCAFANSGVWIRMFSRVAGQWKDEHGKTPEFPVTHWMPLPDHPEAKT